MSSSGRPALGYVSPCRAVSDIAQNIASQDSARSRRLGFKKILKGVAMLWTTSIILLSFWLLGVTTPFTMHGYIHLLLVLAAAVMLVPALRKRRSVD
jgi:hypothetical protein